MSCLSGLFGVSVSQAGRHNIASFRSQTVERVDVVIGEYSGMDSSACLSFATAHPSRACGGQPSPQARPQLIEVLRETEQIALKQCPLGQPSELEIYRNG
jgi:hypothetical protein